MLKNEYAGVNAYLTYIAIRMHFTSSYDYFKYNGQTSTKPESFLKRKDKFFFEKLERKYVDDELIMIFVSNFIVNEKSWVRTIASNQGESILKEWKRKTNSLEYHFQEQMNLMRDEISGENKAKALFKTNGSHPPLILMFIQDQISLETMCILNNLFNYVEYYNDKLEFDPIWEQIRNRIEKYEPFLSRYSKMNDEKMLQIFSKTLG